MRMIRSAIACLLITSRACAQNTAPITDRLRQDVADAPLSMRFKGATADECTADLLKKVLRP
jgi:hypothetical protein